MFETEFGNQDPFNTKKIGGMFIYTHVQEFDNAAAIPPMTIQIDNIDVPIVHPQLLMGHGHTALLPLATPQTIAHELGDEYTFVNSGLMGGKPNLAHFTKASQI